MAGRPARNNDTAVRPYRRCRTEGSGDGFRNYYRVRTASLPMASSSQQQTRWKCGRFKPVLTDALREHAWTLQVPNRVVLLLTPRAHFETLLAEAVVFQKRTLVDIQSTTHGRQTGRPGR
jgi:hypothetical protein